MHRGQPAGHEAANAARCVRDFADLKQTTLVLPEVMWAKKRVMVMECACLESGCHQSLLAVRSSSSAQF
jgi:hypothetical protein